MSLPGADFWSSPRPASALQTQPAFAFNAPPIASPAISASSSAPVSAEWQIRFSDGRPQQESTSGLFQQQQQQPWPCPPPTASSIVVPQGYVMLPLQALPPNGKYGQQQQQPVVEMKYPIEDVVPRLLGTEPQDYLAGLQMANRLTTTFLADGQMRMWGLRVADVERDTINVASQQLLTLLFETRKTRTNSDSVPLLVPFELHSRFMNTPLRTIVYGDLEINGRMAPILSPYTWKHSVNLRLDYEPTPSAKVMTLRQIYKTFLVRMFRDVFMASKEAELASPQLFGEQFKRAVESELISWSPDTMTVAVLEARLLAMLSSLQLVTRTPFVAGTYRDAAYGVREVINRTLATVIGTDLFLQNA